MAFKGVILGVDGPLMLSNDAQAQAWCEAFAESGYNIPFERVRPLIGKGGDQVIPELVLGLTDQEGKGKTNADRCQELILNRYAPTLVSADGSRELVLHMQAVGLQVVFASSASVAELAMFLESARSRV